MMTVIVLVMTLVLAMLSEVARIDPTTGLTVASITQ